MALASPLPLTFYRAVTGLLALAAPLWLAWRTRLGKEDPARLTERYGRASRPRPQGRVMWCHAASVGESLTLLPLLTAILKANTPDNTWYVVVTTGTVTSAALMAERLPAGALHNYFPLDHRPWIARFLDHWRPDLILWTESELWPNTLAEIRARKIPAVMVNGRLSDKAVTGWRRWPALSRDLMHAFTLVLAQSRDDARRFQHLGAETVRTTGNLKLAASPLPADDDAVAALRADIAGRAVWLAASIHPGEDAIAARVHASLKDKHLGLLTVIVPRHPDKAADMTAACRNLGLTVRTRSRGEPIARETDIYMADTMGELGLFYRCCDLVFMGKSLAVGGGQNPAEPALMGCAVVLGSDMSNFRDMTEALCAAGAAARVASADDLTATLDRLLTDTVERHAMGGKARTFMAAEGRSLAETQAALAPFLGRGP
jgi:3-deoxy-D-manno-octulosonic-acid transferase